MRNGFNCESINLVNRNAGCTETGWRAKRFLAAEVPEDMIINTGNELPGIH
jgi:hypothetical protein